MLKDNDILTGKGGGANLDHEAIRSICSTPQSLHAYVANVFGAFSVAFTDKMNRAVTDVTGLSISACQTIVTIGTEPGSTIDDLRRMLGVDHSSMVRAIAKLESRGLLFKERNNGRDARTVNVSLTELGSSTFEKIIKVREKFLFSIVTRLSEPEMNDILSLVFKVIDIVVDEGDDQHRVCRLCDISNCDQRICPVNLAYSCV